MGRRNLRSQVSDLTLAGVKIRVVPVGRRPLLCSGGSRRRSRQVWIARCDDCEKRKHFPGSWCIWTYIYKLSTVHAYQQPTTSTESHTCTPLLLLPASETVPAGHFFCDTEQITGIGGLPGRWLVGKTGVCCVVKLLSEREKRLKRRARISA